MTSQRIPVSPVRPLSMKLVATPHCILTQMHPACLRSSTPPRSLTPRGGLTPRALRLQSVATLQSILATPVRGAVTPQKVLMRPAPCQQRTVSPSKISVARGALTPPRARTPRTAMTPPWIATAMDLPHEVARLQEQGLLKKDVRPSAILLQNPAMPALLRPEAPLFSSGSLSATVAVPGLQLLPEEPPQPACGELAQQKEELRDLQEALDLLDQKFAYSTTHQEVMPASQCNAHGNTEPERRLGFRTTEHAEARVRELKGFNAQLLGTSPGAMGAREATECCPSSASTALPSDFCSTTHSYPGPSHGPECCDTSDLLWDCHEAGDPETQPLPRQPPSFYSSAPSSDSAVPRLILDRHPGRQIPCWAVLGTDDDERVPAAFTKAAKELRDWALGGRFRQPTAFQHQQQQLFEPDCFSRGYSQARADLASGLGSGGYHSSVEDALGLLRGRVDALVTDSKTLCSSECRAAHEDSQDVARGLT